MLKKIIILTLGLLLIFPGGAQAATFLAEELVSPPDDILSDLYAAGQRVVVSHLIEGDVFIGAATIEILPNAVINGDIFAAGETVDITGTVEDDIMTAGSVVKIRDLSVDDVFAAGSSLEINQGVQIRGSAYLAGNEISLAGQIAGDVHAAGDRIAIIDGATIEGNLYTYGKDPIIATGATVAGEHIHKSSPPRKNRGMQDQLLTWVTSVLAWFMTTILVLYLLPSLVNKTIAASQNSPLSSFGLGALWYLLLIPATILLLITLVGIPIAIGLWGLTILVGILSFPLASLLVGAWLMRRIWKVETDHLTWQHALLGVVVLRALGVVPVIGWLIVLFLLLTTTGSLYRSWWGSSLRQES